MPSVFLLTFVKCILSLYWDKHFFHSKPLKARCEANRKPAGIPFQHFGRTTWSQTAKMHRRMWCVTRRVLHAHMWLFVYAADWWRWDSIETSKLLFSGPFVGGNTMGPSCKSGIILVRFKQEEEGCLRRFKGQARKPSAPRRPLPRPYNLPN